MSIFVVFSNLTCLNLGDLAMLQITVRRLRKLWADAQIFVTTSNPAAMKFYCPDTIPVECANEWMRDRFLLGKLHQVLPGRVSRTAIRWQHSLWQRTPGLMSSATWLKLKLLRKQSGDFRTFLKILRGADLVVACGAGGLGDQFPAYSSTFLTILGIATRSAQATAMFSHGFCPMDNPELLARCGSVLPKLSLIALREACMGPALIEKMGIDPDCALITGDDATELAYEARPPTQGASLGFNLRIANITGVEDDWADQLRPALLGFAQDHSLELVPLPIARQQDMDATAIRKVISDYPRVAEYAWSASTPIEVIRLAGRCRLVVTGAYHAAVFALSQGIPTICLCRSAYYQGKLKGLARQFGDGCQVLPLCPETTPRVLPAIMRDLWEAAPSLSASLKKAAHRQIQESEGAYALFRLRVAQNQPRWNPSGRLPYVNKSNPTVFSN